MSEKVESFECLIGWGNTRVQCICGALYIYNRQQRLAEMRAKMMKAKFGSVYEISKPDYVREVNQAGEGVWVVVNLYNNR